MTDLSDRPDFDQIRADYDLLDVVERWIGPPAEGDRGHTPRWCCPFHAERTPSFVVFPKSGRWKCFGACNCSGGVIDFAMMMLFGRIENEGDLPRLAAEAITGRKFQKFERLPAPEREDEALAPMPTWDEIKSHHHYKLDQTLHYFGARHIGPATVERFMLGRLRETLKVSHWAYKFRDGSKVWFSSERYAFPWTYGKQISGMNGRRDDAYCRAKLDLEDPHLIARIRLDMAARDDLRGPDEFTLDDLIRVMYGPKYKKVRDHRGHVYNINRLLQLDADGQVVLGPNHLPLLQQLEYILINEGEPCTLSSEELGFYNVSAKYEYGIDYRYLFSQVAQPIIVANSDEAGRNYAEDMYAAIGNRYTRIITPPAPFKDQNEVIVYSPDLAREWLFRQHIQPHLQGEIHSMNSLLPIKVFIDPTGVQAGLRVPERSRDGDAGFDLAAGYQVIVSPVDTAEVETHVGFVMPPTWAGIIKERSGFNRNAGLILHGGLIDSNFRGTIKIFVRNVSDKIAVILKGQRIAQIVFTPCYTLLLDRIAHEDRGETARGDQHSSSSGEF